MCASRYSARASETCATSPSGKFCFGAGSSGVVLNLRFTARSRALWLGGASAMSSSSKASALGGFTAAPWNDAPTAPAISISVLLPPSAASRTPCRAGGAATTPAMYSARSRTWIVGTTFRPSPGNRAQPFSQAPRKRGAKPSSVSPCPYGTPEVTAYERTTPGRAARSSTRSASSAAWAPGAARLRPSSAAESGAPSPLAGVRAQDSGEATATTTCSPPSRGASCSRRTRASVRASASRPGRTPTTTASASSAAAGPSPAPPTTS